MILPIILFIVIVLVLAIIIMFSFYVFLPSIDENNKEKFDDPIISSLERDYKLKQEKKCQVNPEQRAIVLCSCNKDFKLKPTFSNDGYTCFMAKTVQGSGTDCKYGCIGLGDCTRACPQQAISIVNHTAVISDLCCGCGECLNVCPQNIIKLIPKNQEKIILCNNLNKEDLTSCTARFKEIKIECNDKKDFKIWKYCYKLLTKLK